MESRIQHKMVEMETLGTALYRGMKQEDMDESWREDNNVIIINGEVTVPYGHQQF
jgi:hypothetical protein